MTKTDRKLVHDLANKLHLKSKSVGNGRTRFTTIIKTSRSAQFEVDEESVNSVLRQGKFMKRMDVRQRAMIAKKPFRGTGKTEKYREGEQVGAEAAPLGADNRGRMMLEKMGYTQGMVLGAVGNTRGIAVPITAKMKWDRSGLQG